MQTKYFKKTHMREYCFVFTRLLYQIRKMTILDCESIISVQRVSHLKFSSCGKISADGIGNSQRSNVFVKGNAREDQK